jgi:lipopolysaccharide transport system ATP-binding protein
MCSKKTNPLASDRDTAIRVENISKAYRLYEKPEDRLKESIHSRFNRMLKRDSVRYCKEFKALDDVTFEVGKGETVGIIGRNGSGKSTLLQIISGTLSPSSGQIDVTGRVAALLELGSGFHPDFSGRENVYMNAALYGMEAKEVDRKFDEIALFADLGDFLEQPVKTYSSGMMLRLAFAVIAQIDADILVIDEALAVGDAVFIQKCMRFIKTFQERGTLLFVSHDLAAVQNLCQSAVWLEEGRVKASGTTLDITEAYLKSTLQEIYGDGYQLQSTAPAEENDSGEPVLDYGATMSQQDNFSIARGWKTGAAELLNVTLSTRDNEAAGVLKGNEKVRMAIKAKANHFMGNPILGFIVRDRLGQDLFGENTLPFSSGKPMQVNEGEIFQAVFDFRLPILPNGEYVIMASVADGSLEDNVQHHYLHDALVLTISSSKVRWGLTGIPFEQVLMEIIDG